MEKNRQKLEATQKKQLHDLDGRHEEDIARIIEQEDNRRRILEEYQKQREARSRDLTRDDSERERGRDR